MDHRYKVGGYVKLAKLWERSKDAAVAEMRAGATLGKALQSEYMTVSGTCFINQSSPVMTISKNGIRFSKACHSRLDDCEYVELLYNDYIADHQMNMFEDFIGYQGSAVLDEPVREEDSFSKESMSQESEISENILLPDLAKQSESIEQQSGEIAERGMPT